MIYLYKIRYVVEEKLHTLKGRLNSSTPLNTANACFQAIANDLPPDRLFETFSIMEFRLAPESLKEDK